MSDQLPSFLEDDISQIPALQLLQNLGWQYLTPEEAISFRDRKLSNVILDGVLIPQLRKLNKIRFKGAEYEFSEANIQSAIQSIKEVLFDGLVRTNEKIYDLLILGKSLSQTIDGDTKSFPLFFIDWKPETFLTNNVFHVTEEFEVERTASHQPRRPDLVLFVNGIPLAVIECKRPDLKDPIGEAISQQLRNQRDDEIPKLFLYSQLLLGVSKNEAKYGTTGTALKFWSVWKEEVDTILSPIVNKPLTTKQKDRLFSARDPMVRTYFENLEKKKREVTPQDRTLFSLCRPERLLDITFNYTLFDAGEKKVARYQQYFCIKKILKRIQQKDKEGRRKGGVVWHTQGSGKSLTMVMLAKAIVRENLQEYKIVLVTDRVDLDDQIYQTFRHCDLEPDRAQSGRNLAKLLEGTKSRVVTTIIDKFETAVLKCELRNESENVFVLVDESHRGQYGAMHTRMRKALPNACFIGFTGTPVKRKEKDTINKFGGLIDTYTIRQAVEDKAVVPLLYEGRDVEQQVDRKTIDRWFDQLTAKLTVEQRADLKKKFSSTDQLNKAEQKVKEIAFDIGIHFRDNWQGTPYKAQLVTQDKSTALLYKKYLDEFNLVSSEVLISGPDDREGNEEVDEEKLPAVVSFWKKMMSKHGSEEQYNKNVINSFKHGEHPEIIIVVDKLLTGFDAPRNTVLYLTRQLKEHTLLQAIARVNRLYEGKDFGYIIDYRGVLQNLNKAFDLYGKLEDFDAADLEDAITDLAEEVRKLPQRHSDLWDIFKGIKNKQDEEQYEQRLTDQEVREQFYERLSAYSRNLAVALSSIRFMEDTPSAKVEKYKADLTFFVKLRVAVKKRYAEVVDFKEYEAKIQKLIDTHVTTGAVEKVTTLINIFDKDAFLKEIEKLEGTASKADTIAHRTKKTIIERMEEDPAFYRKFSEMLEEAIRAFREKRLADRDYLNKVMEIADSIRNRSGDSLPAKLQNHDVAKAFYGVLLEPLGRHAADAGEGRELSADAALRIDKIIQAEKIVSWTSNADVQNRIKNQIEDYLHDLKQETGLSLTFEDIDLILEKCLDIARRRYPG
ncbi:type I restriction endonuclease subunit R [Telmatocola sphagniphila]|uniref:Type I restriction enzyme endonuclease subunit n=1 Tax=Telmatocola sphagniphila TaxID=1123043 RepID=A0A8E6ES74_9BACT|nr:HsdR family type I site-specific deoxyribonuclease [Telmatocola sphagniphila]QVL30289.1 type I restriction endonuclease subunit R [Telmatocola sphagniphila]